jgi:hypothetical protein
MITRHELTDLSYHLLSVTPYSQPNLTVYEEKSTPWSKYGFNLKRVNPNFVWSEVEYQKNAFLKMN